MYISSISLLEPQSTHTYMLKKLTAADTIEKSIIYKYVTNKQIIKKRRSKKKAIYKLQLATAPKNT